MNNRLLKLFSLLLFTLLCPIEVSADDYSYQGTIEIKVGETKYIQLPTNIYSVALTGYYPQGKWVLSDNNDNAEIVSGWGTLQGCKVKGKKAGKNIKLTFSGNSVLYDMLWSFTGYYLINVVSEDVKVTSISLNSSSISLKEGATKQLTATVSPSNATDKSVSWSSSNTSVVSVNSSGLITAKSAGNATITCKANDGSGKQATCSVTVTAADPVKVTEVKLSYTSLTMRVDETKTLSASISPSNATDRTVSWSSSNASVATVDNDGKITGKSRGKSTITCKANDGSGKQATCEVTVNSVSNYSYFKAKTVEGVEMQFYVYHAEDGICSVSGSPSIDKNTKGKITIPSEAEGLKVVEIGSMAFSGCKGITEVVVPSSVEKIEYAAFRDCTSLVKVALGNGVKSLGNNVFYGCTSLQTITGISQLEEIGSSVFNVTSNTYIPWYNSLPDGLIYLGKVLYKYKGTMPDNTAVNVKDGTTMIGYKAFDESKGLVGITIPQSVKKISNNILARCPNLSSITVAVGNEKYDSRNNCNAIVESAKNMIVAGCKTTTFPSSITAIGYDAFWGSGLTELVIPNSIDSIADYAFEYNESLVSLAIGKGARKIEKNAFNGCSKLNSIAIASTNPYFDSRDNCNAIIEKATNKLILGCPATVIPSSVKVIGEGAFRNNEYDVYSLLFADNVERIEDNAAMYNYRLTSLVLGKKIKKIGKEVFYGCGALRTIHSLAIDPAEMDESAFNYYSSNPDSIYKSATLYVPIGSKINYMTSEGWSKFKKIVEIADNAVAEGTVFKAKTAEGADLWFKVTDADQKKCELIGSPTNISGKVTIPANPEGYALISIADNAFYSYNDERRVTEIIIPEGVTSIGNSALESWQKTTTSITLPSTLTTIGNWAFNDCAIKSIVIPKAVTSIGKGVFAGCSSLEQITVETGNMVYESLEGSNAVIEKATNKLIAGCKTTKIPENVIIGGNTFRDLDGFTSITIPAGVKEIEKYAFYGCRDLTSVISLSTAPSPIDNLAFANYEGYIDGQSVYSFTPATLYVPIGCKSIYQSTEGWKNFQNIVEFDPSTLGKHVTMDSDKDAPVFDLFGRKLSRPRKGINIINGRKVIVK